MIFTETAFVADLDRVLGPDPGLNNLADHAPDPYQRRYQRAWASTMIALHQGGAFYEYRAYAAKRSKAMSHLKLDSWTQLEPDVLRTWRQDLYGFLCDGCGGATPRVLNADIEQMCRECAEQFGARPVDVSPVWRPACHSVFAWPGPDVNDPTANTKPLVTTDWKSGDRRVYGAGHLTAVHPGSTGIPGLEVQHSTATGDMDAPTVSMGATADRGVSMTAEFVYEGDDFRFVSGFVRTDSGVSAFDEVHAFLGAVLDGSVSEDGKR
jgi:hypothetical protein